MARDDDKVKSLLDQFVCVRLVKMQGVDLDQFQFDYDLSWAGLFLNADGTVYGRYGARDERGPMVMNSLEGLRATMRRVLELHRGYPRNRGLLAAKRGPKPRFGTPRQFPVHAIQKMLKKEFKKKDCIHCHMIHEAHWRVDLKEKRYDPRNFSRYPPPQSVGLEMAKDAAATVQAVVKDSPAQQAGIQKGDQIRILGGQAIASIADIVWVLHHAGDSGEIKGRLRRKGKTEPFTLSLAKGWRPMNLSWRGSMWQMPPWPRMWSVDLPEQERQKLEIGKDQLAFLVKLAWGPDVTRAGIRKGDVIVEYDGRRKRCSYGEFSAWLRLHKYERNSKLQLKVLRGGREREIQVIFRQLRAP